MVLTDESEINFSEVIDITAKKTFDRAKFAIRQARNEQLKLLNSVASISFASRPPGFEVGTRKNFLIFNFTSKCLSFDFDRSSRHAIAGIESSH